MLNNHVNALALTVLAASAGTVANAQTYTKTITLPVSTSSAEQIAVDPIGNKIFVAVTNFQTRPYDYLVEIDGKTDTIIKSVEIPAIGYAIATDPVKGLVYVAGTDANNNSKLGTFLMSNLKEVESVTLSTNYGSGFGLQGVAVNALTHEVYVANAADNEIDVVNCAKVTRISTGANVPFGITVNPLLNTIYASELDGSVAVVDGKTKKLVANNTVGSAEGSIVVNLLTGDVLTPNTVYTPNSTAQVLNAAGTLLTNVPVGNTPIGIAVDPITSLAFVANTQDGTVSRFTDSGTTSTDATPATFPVSALFLALNPVTEKVYASSPDSSPTVTVFSEK